MATTEAPPTTFLPTLTAVALASTLLPLAVTAPAVGLPAIAEGLGASSGAAAWLLNGYAIALATTVLAAGSLADRFGRRRMLIGGTTLFALMSLTVAVAPSILVADLARVVQGIGAAGILASGAAVLAHGATGAARAKAFGVLGASFGSGLAAGPVVAGLLTPLGWRVPFLVVAVLAAGAAVLARNAGESRNPEAASIDLPGVTLFCGALLALSCAFVVAPDAGWLGASTLGLLAAAVALGAAFAAVELRVAQPMFDVRLFARPAFVAVVCQPFTVTFGFVILLVYLPPFLQGVGGHGVLGASVLLLPLTVPVLVLPLAAGRVVSLLGTRGALVAGSVLIAAGSALLLLLRSDASLAGLAPGLFVFGLGVGLAFSVMDNAAVGAVPVERAGTASGMFNTMRLSGESVAIAAASAVLTSLTAAHLGGGSAAHEVAQRAVSGRGGTHEAAAALTGALHTVGLGLAALAALGAAGTWLALREP